MQLVPGSDPPDTVPTITLDGVQGVVIYGDWTSGRSYEHVEPVAPIAWPATDLAASAIEIATGSDPLAVQLRYFTGDLPPDGIPEAEPMIEECRAGASDAGCLLESHPGVIYVRFRAPVDTDQVVLNVRWFVPVELRSDSAAAAPVNAIAVGWAQE